MALSDKKILRRIVHEKMVNPALTKAQEEGWISAGLSSAGYDVRIGYTFKIFKWPERYRGAVSRTAHRDSIPGSVFDPKHPSMDFIEEVTIEEGEVLVLNSYEYAIGPTIEYFKIPKDVIVIVLGKSTYARAGIIINCTPAEPGWEGHLAVEIFNATNKPTVIYPGEGIAQFLFFKVDGEVLRSYDDKEGKYQGQKTEEMLGKTK